MAGKVTFFLLNIQEFSLFFKKILFSRWFVYKNCTHNSRLPTEKVQNASRVVRGWYGG